MKNIVYISSLLLVFFLMSFECEHKKTSKKDNGQKFPNNMSTITIDNYKNIKRLNFYYQDSLFNGSPVTVVGKTTRVILKGPVLFLEANAKQIPFLIYPNERINVKYANSDSLQMYIIGNERRTNELNFFRKLVQKTGNIYFNMDLANDHKKVETINKFNDLQSLINNLKNERLQFLKDYNMDSPVSNEFLGIAIGCIQSKAFADSILLIDNNKELLKANNSYQKLISAKLNDFNKLRYTPFAVYYFACVQLAAKASNDGFNYMNNTEKQFEDRFDFIIKNFRSKARDFLMAKTIYIANTTNTKISDKYLNTFNKLCSDDGYKLLVNKKLTENDKFLLLKKDNNLLLPDGVSTMNLKKFIAMQKGKLILMDFWASWCAPCREEMPYLATLKKLYKNQKITFVSISSDKRIEDWLKAYKEESLGIDNNFLFLNFEMSPYKKVYKINSIPRYLLLGKNGEMINSNAPRPNDQRLKALINSCLK